MIHKPTRREILKYAGMGALAFGVPLLLKVRPAHAAITLVQVGNPANGGNNISVSISNTTAGNGLIIYGGVGNVVTPASPAVNGETISDTHQGYNSSIGCLYFIHYVKQLQGSGTKTFTTTGNNYSAWFARIIEIHNQDTSANLTKSAGGEVNTGSGTTGSSALNTVSDNTALFGICSIYGYNSGQPLTTDPSPTNLVHIGNSGGPPFTTSANYRLDTGSAGTKTASFYFADAAWGAISVAVKLSTGGGPPTDIVRHRRVSA